MGTHSGEVMPRVTGHCEGVSLTECWGDTTTGHLMCECPESCPLASHNRSLRTLGVQEPESEAFPALGDGAEEERRGDGWTPDTTLSQNNHIALLFYKLIQDDDLSALLIYLVIYLD